MGYSQGSPRSHTCFHGAVDVGFGFIIDPVESGLHRQPGQGAVLALVSVRRGDVHGPALVVQRLLEVVAVLVPTLGDPQLHPRPLIHHGDRQRVQLVFASLRGRGSRTIKAFFYGLKSTPAFSRSVLVMTRTLDWTVKTVLHFPFMNNFWYARLISALCWGLKIEFGLTWVPRPHLSIPT